LLLLYGHIFREIIDTRHPDDPDDEPAFLEEWEKADDAITIIGAACLDLLRSTLHAFLDDYMDQIGDLLSICGAGHCIRDRKPQIVSSRLSGGISKPPFRGSNSGLLSNKASWKQSQFQ
jgi:hypothetical protein